MATVHTHTPAATAKRPPPQCHLLDVKHGAKGLTSLISFFTAVTWWVLSAIGRRGNALGKSVILPRAHS